MEENKKISAEPKNYDTGIKKKDLLGWMAVSGILGFSILLFFANYFHYLDEKEQGFEFLSFHWPYSLFSDLCVHFSAAIIIGIIVILFIKKYTDLGLEIKFKELSKEINDIKEYTDLDLTNKFEKLSNEINDNSFKSSKFLQYTTVDIGLNQAIKKLEQIESEEEKRIYIIGIGKSEVKEYFNIIPDYWKITEEKLNTKGSKIKYKRITAATLDSEFKEHLRNCLKANDSGNPRVKIIASSDEFAISITLLIIGEDFLFISPTSPNNDYEKAISRNCFITEEPKIVDQYAKHFLEIWHRRAGSCKPITKGEEINSLN